MESMELSADNPNEGESQDSDYDGAWKETLRGHLEESIRNCFPSLASEIDWTIEPIWLDKEISQISGRFGHRNREVDLLFKVRLLSGREQWILCHLEVQTSYESEFESRIDLYNAGLKWMFQQDVVTLVILADLKSAWRPQKYEFALGDFRRVCQFSICKLLDRLESDWADNNSLIVQVSRAQIAALRTSGNPEARYSVKTQLVRNLYTLGYTSDKIRELFRLIDWMMRLRPDLDRRFSAELVAFEEELHMPYVTSIERVAKEEGREEGTSLLLVRLLNRKLGHLPENLQQQLVQLKFEQSQSLADALFEMSSLEDLQTWLASQSRPE